jgi:hypothetical protein
VQPIVFLCSVDKAKFDKHGKEFVSVSLPVDLIGDIFIGETLEIPIGLAVSGVSPKVLDGENAIGTQSAAKSLALAVTTP